MHRRHVPGRRAAQGHDHVGELGHLPGGALPLLRAPGPAPRAGGAPAVGGRGGAGAPSNDEPQLKTAVDEGTDEEEDDEERLAKRDPSYNSSAVAIQTPKHIGGGVARFA